MKSAYELGGNIQSLYKKLQEYKITTESLTRKVESMKNQENAWKVNHQKVSQERDSLKATINDLKTQLKANLKLSDRNEELKNSVKHLNRKIREHELEQMRMSAQHSQVIHDLNEYIKELKASKDLNKIDDKRAQSILRHRRVSSGRRKSSDMDNSRSSPIQDEVDKTPIKSEAAGSKDESIILEELQELVPFSRPTSQLSHVLESYED
jgi:chromosome segregation ATPase